jgi:hypothetical protein
VSRNCAFCPSTAKLTAEHLWSDWMNALLPGKKRFKEKNTQGQIIRKWGSDDLNWKAKVVCGECNNGWMSDIESDHAKPALADLISGKRNIPINDNRARSIALFCFKTAAVFDLISKNHAPFFRREERYAFRDTLTIPSNVGMWMVHFAPVGEGRVHTGYLAASLSPAHYFQMYVCTFGAEHFVFQLVAARTADRFVPTPGFEYLAVPFWPRFGPNFRWPPFLSLRNDDDFQALSLRWKDISFLE